MAVVGLGDPARPPAARPGRWACIGLFFALALARRADRHRASPTASADGARDTDRALVALAVLAAGSPPAWPAAGAGRCSRSPLVGLGRLHRVPDCRGRLLLRRRAPDPAPRTRSPTWRSPSALVVVPTGRSASRPTGDDRRRLIIGLIGAAVMVGCRTRSACGSAPAGRSSPACTSGPPGSKPSRPPAPSRPAPRSGPASPARCTTSSRTGSR